MGASGCTAHRTLTFFRRLLSLSGSTGAPFDHPRFVRRKEPPPLIAPVPWPGCIGRPRPDLAGEGTAGIFGLDLLVAVSSSAGWSPIFAIDLLGGVSA